METASGSVDASGGGKSAEADGDAETADGDDRGTGALQDGEEDARPAKDSWVEGYDSLLLRVSRRLRDL